PGDGARRAAGTPTSDAAGDTPPLGSVLASSVWSIPQSQTITDQLATIQEHNHAVRQRRNDVLDIAGSMPASELAKLAAQLFGLYRRRRIASTFESFVYSSFPAAAASDPAAQAGQQAIGKRNKEAMRVMFASIRWDEWIPPEWPKLP